MEEIKKILTVFLILVLVAIPAMAPGFFIALGLIVWPITYIVIWIMSIGHDASNTVPWTIVDTVQHPIAMIFFLGALGLINGVRGVVAMLVSWGPYLLLPTYLLGLGVSVENDRGWSGHMVDNYQDARCEMRPRGLYDGPCTHRPLPGRNLPVFATGPKGEILWTGENGDI